jgi:hypothetical protein
MRGRLIGHSVSEATREKLRKFREGKSYLELFGSLEKVNEIKEKIRKFKGKGKWHHSEETKQKISKILTGRKLSKEHRINIGLVQIGRKNNPRTEETKRKIGLANKGRKPSITARLGKHHSEEVKRILSEKTIEHIRKFGFQVKPIVGKYETHILDTIEEFINYKILRQKQVGRFSIDGYCPALNLAIEIDEVGHFRNGLYRESDVKREQKIKEALHCQFFRIKVV